MSYFRDLTVVEYCSSENYEKQAVYYEKQRCQSLVHVRHGSYFNTLRLWQNGRHFADDIFKGIFWNENVWIPIKFSLKFVPKGPINNIPALVQIMAWRRPDDKPLSEPMIVSLPTHICVTRPQSVKSVISEHMWRIRFISILGKSHRTPLVISWYWFRQWLGAVRRQVTSRDSIDPNS